jgi:hypothetical protein
LSVGGSRKQRASDSLGALLLHDEIFGAPSPLITVTAVNHRHDDNSGVDSSNVNNGGDGSTSSDETDPDAHVIIDDDNNNNNNNAPLLINKRAAPNSILRSTAPFRIANDGTWSPSRAKYQ